MEKEKKIFSLIVSLSIYAYIREKYPDYVLNKNDDEQNIEEIKKRLLDIDAYAYIPDKVFIISSTYKKMLALIQNGDFKENILVEDLNKKSEYLTNDEKRDIMDAIIHMVYHDHSVSKNEKSLILQIRKFLNYPYQYSKVMKDYQESELKESVAKVGLFYFSNATESVTSDKKLSSKHQRVLSLLFLSLAGILTFFSFTGVVSGWFWDSEKTISITPGIISAVIGICLLAPLYFRNILKWNTSIYSIISFILILLVISSFVEIILGNNNNGTTQALIVSAVLLSWLGISAVAGVSWILVLGTSVYSIVSTSIVMGFSGWLYILFGFLGLILHAQMNPGQLVEGLKEEYSTGTKKILDTVHSDIQATKDVATSVMYP